MNGEKNGIVIKLGTAAMRELVANSAMMEARVAEIAQFKKEGRNTIFVTSGAVGWGMKIAGDDPHLRYLIDLRERGGEDAEFAKRTLAGIGQHNLMNMYQGLFGKHDIHVYQLVVNEDQLHPDSPHYIAIARELNFLAKDPHVIPIVNENDAAAISDERRKDFDNDILAARLTTMNGHMGDSIGHMISISISGGIYTCDPVAHPEKAKLIRHIDWAVDSPEIDISGKSASGTGGMGPKYIAATYVADHGIRACVVGPQHSLLDSITDRCEGTVFLPRPQPSRTAQQQLYHAGRKYGLV